MFEIRRSLERGLADHGWLRSFHTFSFAEYHDPRFMGLRALRVINEDRVAPSAGFPTHPHRDMEIVSYVLSGALEHRDSMGNGSVIRPGDVQRMSAGTGVFHSEFNASDTETTHFLQIWLFPTARGLTPGYEQRHFDAAEKRGRLRLIASPDGADGSVRWNQTATLFSGLFDGDEKTRHEVAPGHVVYLQVARGSLSVNGEVLTAGDAVATDQALELSGGKGAEVLLFDLD